MQINAILPPKGRDLRLDLFRGVANWAIYLDHIPDNVVNWITTRNYGFSDAADLFVFISGYTASFVYARMMLERGFIVGATRLFKAGLAALCRPHRPVRHLHRFDRLCRAAFRRSGHHQRIQRGGSGGRQRDRNPAPGIAAEIQAGQSRRASALHRADGAVSAGAVADAAPARFDHAGVDRAVARGAMVRLEFRRLSRPGPGTSIRSAGSCCSCSDHGARSAAP